MKLLLLIVCGMLTALVSGGCSGNDDCVSCANDSQYWVSCRWCPLTNACHSVVDLIGNDCSSSQQVKAKKNCAEVEEPSGLQYDPNFAEELAKWSSLAYIRPGRTDKDSLQSTVTTHINSNYKLVEFIRNDCDLLFEYIDCGAAIAVSEIDKQIVVAFRGTTADTQLLEQALLLLTGLENFSPTGGQISSYNKNAHDALYPCVKSLIQDLLEADNSLKVAITGHSLGGVQAQLTGVNLITDGVVSQDNLHIYTFGSPRVGDKSFAYKYDRKVGNSWRVVTKKDPVPQIIPSILAYHTRREIYYDHTYITPYDEYRVCGGNEDSKCSYGNTPCLTCIDEHNQYFVDDIHAYMADRTSGLGTAAEQGTRDQCDTFRYY